MKTIYILFFSFLLQFSNAQDVVITLSALHDTIPIELDTIKLQNLSNGTAIAITDLPTGVFDYEIDLSQGIYINIGENSGFNENILLFCNTPDYTKVLVKSKERQLVSVNVFDLAGKELFKTRLTCQPGNNIIEIKTPSVTLVQVSSNTMLKTFKILGSKNNNKISVENTGIAGMDNPGLLKNKMFYSDYIYTPGDSLKIIAVKINYHPGFVVKTPEHLDHYQVYLNQPCDGYETLTDYDGNVYNTVQIGEHCWMKENLNTTHYADGTPLVDGTGATVIDFTTKYWFNYNDDPEIAETYGRLYVWVAVMNDEGSSNNVPSGVQGVCPNGWHVPSKAEWEILVYKFGGEDIAGGKLKECGYEHWNYPNTGADNHSGFYALGNGVRGSTNYGGLKILSTFWTSTFCSGPDSYCVGLFNNKVEIEIYGDGYEACFQQRGMAVRCIKD